MEEWNLLTNEFKKSEGIGGQSSIYINKEHNKIKKQFTVKDRKFYLIEKNNLLKLNHNNIIKLLDFNDNEFCLYFKYYSNGSAFKWYMKNNDIKICDINIVIGLLRDIITGLEYTHKCGITHRDIKLENILIGELKEDGRYNHVLCDYGLSREALTKMNRICGTYNYMSPEMWFSKDKSQYNYKTDIFSLGSLIIECVNGTSPFYDEYRCRFKSIYKNIDKCLNNPNERYYERKIFDDIWYSNDEWNKLRELLISMIQPNPTNRIDLSEIINFINNIGDDTISDNEMVDDTISDNEMVDDTISDDNMNSLNKL
jgi:serine/threonine protein kinase